MKKSLLAVSVLFLAGCAVGPNSLTNKVHDWQNKNYEEQPLVTGVLTQVIPVYPIVGFLASIPDVLVLNTVQFWGSDVWEGHGAAFVHDNPKGDKKPWFEK